MSDKRYGPIDKSLNLPPLEDIKNSLNEDDEDHLDDDDLQDEDDGFNYDYEFEEDSTNNELSYEDLQEKIKKLNSEIEEKSTVDETNSKITEQYHKDVNELFNTAQDDYKEVFQAALAMEPNHGAKFLQGATKLLELALRSKNSTMDKQLEIAKLQLSREKMIRNEKNKKQPNLISPTEEDDEEGTNYGYGDNGGKIMDRNELLQRSKKKNDSDNNEE